MADQIDEILRAVPMALVYVAADERVIHANELAAQLLGSGLVGRHYITVLRQPGLLDCIELAFRGGESGETQFLGTEARRETTYQVRAVPIESPEGTAVLVSFEDVTQMQQAGQMRRDFVANVSHELRTPLTALLGFVETLQGAARDDAVARDRFLGIMQKEAERMNRLVHDLLSLSRVESEERVRPTRDVDVGDLLKAAAERLRDTAENNGVTIEVTVDASPAIAPGDADQLMQVFTNLLENAVKYGASPGRVTAHVTSDHNEPMLRGPGIRIDIQDEGEGIDQFHIQRLTERFYRIDSHRSREMGGTGLGLAIVKHIINRHRGRLRISSKKGKGSLFSVILPTP